MRRPLLIFLICTVAVLLFLVYQVSTLLELLVVDGHTDAISPDELPPVGSEKQSSSSAQLIPKIIHQTYKDVKIPEVWKTAQASCLRLHQEPEWEYKLWTDKSALQFIEDKYPQHLSTFKSYPYGIQRADAIRYFVLEYYGGIYIDLDDGCARPLDPLLKYPAFARKTQPTGISNDVLGAVPHHPYFQRVIAELPRYHRSWILPYITIMSSTGPLFLSIIWRLYCDDGFNVGDGAEGGRIRILWGPEYSKNSWSFFSHHKGDSWHSYDVRFMFWMLHHWKLVTLFGFVLGFSLLLVAWKTYRNFIRPRPALAKRPLGKHSRASSWLSLGSGTEHGLPTRRDD
ncbi:glycosyltransferase family 32 protein [Dissoconium aciculare CBS 342.82]|uniref:Glycosyltransferase family 32 protein n=1 Tax=Dissoconium aciculare CBS 342.82 TaxID=1314786 RepID=A0A6J3M550_9PEZI|nr:glycosyltransferase family 32 protein [Dissoconium aciculare CBS 342.82]KAF1823176.1 glycosyltransferase family 32 protein [Dissoconium aciculare CBS 342.82]